jgi:hypothetical protein
MCEIDTYFFGLIEDFFGLWQSSDNEKHIDKRDSRTSKKWHPDAPLEKPCAQCWTYNKSEAKNHSKKCETIGTFFFVWRDVGKNGLDGADISCCNPIDHSSDDVNSYRIPQSHDER